MGLVSTLKPYFFGILLLVIVISLLAPGIFSFVINTALDGTVIVIHIVGAILIRAIFLPADFLNWFSDFFNLNFFSMDVELESTQVVLFFDSIINIFRNIAQTTFETVIEGIDGLNPISPDPGDPGGDVGGVVGGIIKVVDTIG